MKKFLALLLALVMVLGLAACAKDTADDTTPSTTKGNNTDTTPNDNNEDNQPSGNGIIPADQLSHDEAVTITIVLPDMDLMGRDEIMAEAARYVKEKLNVDLKFRYVALSESRETILTTGEWDIADPDAKTFQNLAARNAFMDLTPYVEAGYLSFPAENLTESQKIAHNIGGKQYAFAPYKDLMEGWNFLYNAEIIEGQLGLTVPEWQSGFDLVDFWYDIQEGLKGTEFEGQYLGANYMNWMPFWFQVDGIVGNWNDTLVCTNIDLENLSSYDDIDPMTAFCPYFTEDFAELCRLRKQLVNDGIEPGYQPEADNTRTLENGGFMYTISCGLIEYTSGSDMYELKMSNQKTPYTYTGYVQNVSMVINANSKNPERAMEVLNLMYEDDYWNTLVRCGIEGLDWEDSDNDGVVEWIGRNSAAAQNEKYWRYWYGNGYACSLITGKVDASCNSRDGFVQGLKDLNENGIATPHMGFVFDQSKVSDKVAACSAVVAEYVGGQLLWPASVNDVDATIKELQDKLKANGIDDIIAEVQAQLDAFHAG